MSSFRFKHIKHLALPLATLLLAPLVTFADTTPPKLQQTPAQAAAARAAVAASPIQNATAKDPAKKESAPANVPTGNVPGTGITTPAGSARSGLAIDTGDKNQPGSTSSQGAISAAQGAIGSRNADIKAAATIGGATSATTAPGFNQGFSDKSGVNLSGAGISSGNPLAPAQPKTGAPTGSTGAAGSGMVAECASGATTSATGACTSADGDVTHKGKATDASVKVTEFMNPNTAKVNEDDDRNRKSADGRNEVKYDMNGTKHVFVDGKEVGKIYPGGTTEPAASGCPQGMDGCNTQDKQTWLANLQKDINYQIKAAAKAGATTSPNPVDGGFAVAPGAVVPAASQTGQNLFGNPGTAAAGVNVAGPSGNGLNGGSHGNGAIDPGQDGSMAQGASRSEEPGQFFDKPTSPGIDGRPAQCDAEHKTATTADDCPATGG